MDSETQGLYLGEQYFIGLRQEVRNTMRTAILYHTYRMFSEIMTTRQTQLKMVKLSTVTIKNYGKTLTMILYKHLSRQLVTKH